MLLRWCALLLTPSSSTVIGLGYRLLPVRKQRLHACEERTLRRFFGKHEATLLDALDSLRWIYRLPRSGNFSSIGICICFSGSVRFSVT